LLERLQASQRSIHAAASRGSGALRSAKTAQVATTPRGRQRPVPSQINARHRRTESAATGASDLKRTVHRTRAPRS
jgi:hypothetical protein